MQIATIDKAIAQLREGRMIILADDEQRENEGDFVMVAQLATPEAISFMAEHARTIITLALTSERCEKLKLPLLPRDDASSHDTAFTVSIEAADGVSTGSSAHDRARTIRAAATPDAKPGDLHRPGHVFPLRAVPGGVLNRAGHTEAACDLAQLAGFVPAGIISEIQLADGNMARMVNLEKISQQHNLPLTTIAKLIAYRCETETLIRKCETTLIETAVGQCHMHLYRDVLGGDEHIVLEFGDVSTADTPLVRVLAQPNFLDICGIKTPQRSWTVTRAMRCIADAGVGVIVALHIGNPHPVVLDNLASKGSLGQSHLVRTYGLGAQILRDLGISKMRLLSSPLRLPSMEGYGLTVEQIIGSESEL